MGICVFSLCKRKLGIGCLTVSDKRKANAFWSSAILIVGVRPNLSDRDARTRKAIFKRQGPIRSIRGKGYVLSIGYGIPRRSSYLDHLIATKQQI